MKRILKNILLSALVALFVLASVSCGGDAETQNPTEVPTEAPTEAPTETPTEAPSAKSIDEQTDALRNKNPTYVSYSVSSEAAEFTAELFESETTRVFIFSEPLGLGDDGVFVFDKTSETLYMCDPTNNTLCNTENISFTNLCFVPSIEGTLTECEFVKDGKTYSGKKIEYGRYVMTYVCDNGKVIGVDFRHAESATVTSKLYYTIKTIADSIPSDSALNKYLGCTPSDNIFCKIASDSMSPALSYGKVYKFSKISDVSELAVGDVILYMDAFSTESIAGAARIISVNCDTLGAVVSFTIKCDNNPEPNSEPCLPENIMGVLASN